MTAEPNTPQSPLSVLLSAAARVEEMDKAAMPGPWLYRPNEFDDWGVVRAPMPVDTTWVVAHVRDPRTVNESDLNEHRRNRTDPWGDSAMFVAYARALLPAFARAAALLAEALAEILEGTRPDYSDTSMLNDRSEKINHGHAALASAARLVAEAGGVKGDGKEGGR